MKNARELLKLNVKRLRDAIGLNQADLADKATLSTQMIQKIEYGKTAPSPETLDKIVEALQTTHAELFFDQTLSVPRPASVAEMTPSELEDLVARASKRDGTLNFEIARLKKENAELKEIVTTLPDQFWDAWKKAGPRLQALFLYLLLGRTEDLKRAKPNAHVRNLLAALRKDMTPH